MNDSAFYSRAWLRGRLRRAEVDRLLGEHAAASFNGTVVTITGPGGALLHTAQIGLFHRREMGDWCNEFNRRRDQLIQRERLDALPAVTTFAGHEAVPAAGEPLRDAAGGVLDGLPRGARGWPVYTRCVCGQTITKLSRATHWVHTTR